METSDFQSDGAAAGTRPPAKASQPRCQKSALRKWSPLLALLALLAAEVVELRASGAAQAAFERLNRAFGQESHLRALTPDEVRQVVGREVDEKDLDTRTDVFRWRGSLKTHALYVQYQRLGMGVVARDFACDADPRPGAPKAVVGSPKTH